MKARAMHVLMAAVLLVAMTASSVAALPDVEEVPIYFYTEYETYQVGPGQVGVVQFTYAACTEGLVRVFIKASNFHLKLLKDGSIYREMMPEEADGLWGAVHRFGFPIDGCRGGQKPAYAAWHWVLTDLPEGEYELVTQGWIDHPLTDGADYDGDGTPDVIRPQWFGGETLNYISIQD